MRAPNSRVGAQGPKLGPCGSRGSPELPEEPRPGAWPEGAWPGCQQVCPRPRVGLGAEKAAGRWGGVGGEVDGAIQ